MRSSSGRLLRPPSGGAFVFDAGAVSLEFVHSGGSGPWVAYESLHAPQDLVRWLREPPLDLPSDLPAEEADLVLAREVRHAMTLVARAVAGGTQPPLTAVQAVNRAAARPPLTPQLDLRTGERAWAASPTVEQALSTLARDLIDVLGGPLKAHVRECVAGDCRLVFVDTSRAGRRRWCAMERCGNRAKVRAHRSRRTEV